MYERLISSLRQGRATLAGTWERELLDPDLGFSQDQLQGTLANAHRSEAESVGVAAENMVRKERVASEPRAEYATQQIDFVDIWMNREPSYANVRAYMNTWDMWWAAEMCGVSRW